jgi:hypothetical protein
MALDREQKGNYVLFSFQQGALPMIRSVCEEALALASLGLFLATVAVWAQVLGVL